MAFSDYEELKSIVSDMIYFQLTWSLSSIMIVCTSMFNNVVIFPGIVLLVNSVVSYHE